MLVGWRTDNYNFASRRAIERLGARKRRRAAPPRAAPRRHPARHRDRTASPPANGRRCARTCTASCASRAERARATAARRRAVRARAGSAAVAHAAARIVGLRRPGGRMTSPLRIVRRRAMRRARRRAARALTAAGWRCTWSRRRSARTARGRRDRPARRRAGLARACRRWPRRASWPSGSLNGAGRRRAVALRSERWHRASTLSAELGQRAAHRRPRAQRLRGSIDASVLFRDVERGARTCWALRADRTRGRHRPHRRPGRRRSELRAIAVEAALCSAAVQRRRSVPLCSGAAHGLRASPQRHDPRHAALGGSTPGRLASDAHRSRDWLERQRRPARTSRRRHGALRRHALRPDAAACAAHRRPAAARRDRRQHGRGG